MIKRTILFLIIFALLSASEIISHTIKPKGTMSFATLLLINEKSEILLLRRKGTSFGNGLYSLPGGKIESGETALESAEREAKEETGIEVNELKLVHVVDRQGPETEFYVFVFKPQAWHGIPANCEPNKCDDIAWFPLNKLPEQIIPAHKQAIEMYQNGIIYSQHGWGQK